MPDSSIAFRGRYLDVIWENGAEYTHNRRCRGVVLVIAVTDAREIIFIEQYRLPLKCDVIEYPAGLYDVQVDLIPSGGVDPCRRASSTSE